MLYSHFLENYLSCFKFAIFLPTNFSEEPKICMLSFMFISLSMLGLTAVASPPNEGVCDELVGTTPGLYGLCVAFCEAQDCEATYDPVTDTVDFDDSCRPSSPKVLDNFNKRAGVGGPPMPCVNITENECPCWTEAEINENPAHYPDPNTGCRTDPPFAQLYSMPDPFNPDVALTNYDTNLGAYICSYKGVDLMTDALSRTARDFEITEDQNATCVASIAYQCGQREYP